MMNRSLRQAAKRAGRRRQRRAWDEFRDVTDESYDRHRLLNYGRDMDKMPDQVYANSQYIVMIYRERVCLRMNCDKVMIQRCDRGPVRCWEDIQRIKNEIFGEDAEGFQMFPRQAELVNDFNVYWLWIIRNFFDEWP